MKKLFISLLFCVLAISSLSAQEQWRGKRIGFLGDSMTDPNNTAAKEHYWSYLAKDLGITPCVYAKSGHQWNNLMQKAEAMLQTEGKNLDAIFIWAGTNDFFHDTPMGEFFTVKDAEANVNGTVVPLKHREYIFDENTFCGRINNLLSFLKKNYPTKQIILMTPIHRAFATFSDKNVQPDELYSNSLGLFLDDYIHALRRGAELWSIPVIDLYSDSGLFPLYDEHIQYFAKPDTDRLHPNDAGHRRLADVIEAQLNVIPCY